MLKRIFALSQFVLLTTLSMTAQGTLTSPTAPEVPQVFKSEVSALKLESDFTDKSKLKNIDASAIVVPQDSETLKSFGNCTSSALPPTFEVLVWNVEKGKQKYLWSNDLDYLLLTNDIALIQEGMLDPFMTEVLNSHKEYCWDFAVSFIESAKSTGVVTGSVYKPSSSAFFRSPGREPILRTPKMATLTKYSLSNSNEELLVVNIHALNFVEDRFQEGQMVGLEKIMSKHTGPIIFAGDFNSWTTRRRIVINRVIKSLGLTKVLFPNDTRTFKIDYIYTRGLDLKFSRIHMGITSSDHHPLTAIFSQQ